MRRALLPGHRLPVRLRARLAARLRALLPSLALVLAACQPAAFVLPDVPVPETWPRQAAPEGVEQGIAAEPGGASLGALPWRKILPAPELHALIEEALVANADLRIAIERIELARAQYGIERAALFPGLNASASATRERMPGFDPRANRVGENAVLGANVVVCANAFVGENVRIGENSMLHPNVTIYEDCVLGKNVVIHAGSVIGADGFGYVATPAAHEKLPQIGNVVIEDDVEIGACATVDRAAIGFTGNNGRRLRPPSFLLIARG